MEDEVLVEVEGVSKKFSKHLKTSLKYGLIDILKKSIGMPLNQNLRKDEFWAVNDINFKLRRGECIGLIGHNGAGKSTLLKILNGIYAPDKGQVVMRGKVSALIELGAGFNPILTGRENIYNNAAILGFSRKETDEKLQSIIEFSEIEEFLDMPVKNYSSGMKVRLGFAVAAHLDPDILIIDEVLAVGDISFSLKCFKKIDEILPHTAVIFVSHSLVQISRICTSILVLDKGNEVYLGDDVSEGIQTYLQKQQTNELENIIYLNTDKFEISDYTFNQEAATKFTLQWNTPLEIGFKMSNSRLKKTPYFVVQIFDKEQKPIVATYYKPDDVSLEKSTLQIKIDLGEINLGAAKYSINLAVFEEYEKKLIYKANSIATFDVVHEIVTYAPILKKINISVL